MVKVSPQMVLRKCHNIKSKNHSDQQCSSPATHGEFCAKHSVHPTRFPLFKDHSYVEPRGLQKRLSVIQKLYKLRSGLRRFRSQGPATTSVALSENTTELSSFDPVDTIPLLYRFSFADHHKHIWLFDIRTLVQLLELSGLQILNPYTRHPMPKNDLHRLQKRISFLRQKKYCLLFPDKGQEFSGEQALHQRVVDVCLQFDLLGYYSSPSWFEDLSLQELKSLYIELYDTVLLDIPEIHRMHLAPCLETLFPLRLTGMQQRKDKKLLHHCVLDVFEKLITTAQEADLRSLGAVYCLRTLAKLEPAIYGNYPWLRPDYEG